MSSCLKECPHTVLEMPTEVNYVTLQSAVRKFLLCVSFTSTQSIETLNPLITLTMR